MNTKKTMLTKKRLIGTLKMFPTELQRDLLYDRMPFNGVPPVVMLPETGMLVLDTDENIRKALDFKYGCLEKAKSISEIFFWITKPNRLQILEFVINIFQINKKDYSEILKSIWVSTEFPHQMPIPKLVSMFRQADTELMMSDEDKTGYNNLPEVVPVFRGLQDKRSKLKGMSWTTKYETAEWFANRWKQGKLYRAEISKKHIFMFTNDRNEYECVVNPRHLQNVREMASV